MSIRLKNLDLGPLVLGKSALLSINPRVPADFARPTDFPADPVVDSPNIAISCFISSISTMLSLLFIYSVVFYNSPVTFMLYII